MVKNNTEKYIFKQYISEAEVLKAVNSNDKSYQSSVCASLTRGCMRCEAVFVVRNDSLKLFCDILVKEELSECDWICFDSLSEAVEPNTLEEDMKTLLLKEAKTYGLSFEANGFERLNGMKKDKKAQV